MFISAVCAVLKLFAWLLLSVCVLAAVTIGADAFTPNSELLPLPVSSDLAMYTAAYLLITGALSWAFLMATAYVVECLVDIRASLWRGESDDD